MSPEGDRIRFWWAENPADPGRATLNDGDVQSLLERIAPGEYAIDLGGTMSLNVLLTPSDRVLRVHRPFVPRRRIKAEQQIRCHLHASGITTPLPMHIGHENIVRCGRRWAETESYIFASQPPHTIDSYRWLFAELGRVHHSLAGFREPVPRSLAATYAPYGSLRRWFAVTLPQLEHVQGGPDAAERISRLLSWLRIHWIPARDLPAQAIHGDFRLGNIRQDKNQEFVVLDFGFADVRPRCYDCAYALAFMVLAIGHDNIAWRDCESIIAMYDQAAGTPLSGHEWAAIKPMSVSVLLYAFAHDGFTDKVERNFPHRLPFLCVAEWLANPGTE